MQAFNYGGNYQYARSRLQDTIVFFEGMPYYVSHVSYETGVCDLIGLITNIGSVAHVDDLVVNNFPLGFGNDLEGLAYYTKLPSRQWKQGIRNDQIWDALRKRHVDVHSESFYKTLRNIYPSVESCFELVDCDEVEGAAFHRHFAVGKTIKVDGFTLKYKLWDVGKIDLADSGKPSIQLFDSHEWLRETVMEAIHGE